MNRNFAQRCLAVLVLLLLVACGSKDNADSPPELNTSSPGRISPFDTLEVEFSKPLASFSDSNIVCELPVRWKKISDTHYQIFGPDTFMTGQSMFRTGDAYILSFIGLEDQDGNKQTQAQSFPFATYHVVDIEFPLGNRESLVGNNLAGGAAVLADSAHFFQGSSLDSGLTIAGFLSHRSFRDFHDERDYYSIWLRTGDSLLIELEGFNTDLDVELIGPYNELGEYNISDISQSLSTGLTPEIMRVGINADRHTSQGLEVVTVWSEYHIVVRYPDPIPAGTTVTPYTLRVQRTAKRN